MLEKRFREYRDGKYRVREFSKHIVAHQGICHGQLTFKGTRVLVPVVLESLARPGRTIEQVAADYHLPVEAIAEALQLATHVIRDRLRLPDPHPDEVPQAKKTNRHATAVRDRRA
jgi:uncharacterized protein (DUF433 family)